MSDTPLSERLRAIEDQVFNEHRALPLYRDMGIKNLKWAIHRAIELTAALSLEAQVQGSSGQEGEGSGRSGDYAVP